MPTKRTTRTSEPAPSPPPPPPPTEPPAATDSGESAQSPAEEKGSDPFSRLWKSLTTEPDNQAAREARQDAAVEGLKGVVAQHDVAAKYNVLILHDESKLIRGDADRIYTAIRQFSDRKPVLLILYSSGGHIEPAYLISQLCRECSGGSFAVAVPRRAKSAATLICCGADELHMGAMSELGPVDPQIGDYPALGLGGAMEYIATLVSKHPAAAEMFAKYLAETVPPMNLGYYERVVESAAQYAERLLDQHKDGLASDPKDIARTLVYSYKDHGFVIDRNEARRIFGDHFIKIDTAEYKLANAVYSHLSLLDWVAGAKNYSFYWVGSCDTGSVFYPKDV